MKQDCVVFLLVLFAVIGLGACAPSPSVPSTPTPPTNSTAEANVPKSAIAMLRKGCKYVMTELCLKAESSKLTPKDGAMVVISYVRNHYNYYENLYENHPIVYQVSIKLLSYVASYTVVKIQYGTDPQWLLVHEDAAIRYVMGLVRNGTVKLQKSDVLPPDKLIQLQY